MGFLSRRLVPRSVRRAVHPVRTAKRAMTPKPIKAAQQAMNPLSNAAYSVERSMFTKPRRTTKAPAYTHGACPVRHRTPEAAERCRNR